MQRLKILELGDYTQLLRKLDDISFTATDRAGEKIIINKEYINKNLDNLVKDTDLSKFILNFNLDIPTLSFLSQSSVLLVLNHYL